tara:strand:- start:683 stop:1024 length:342 start_codon:yes stop_codon:yes gene_type:complete
MKAFEFITEADWGNIRTFPDTYNREFANKLLNEKAQKGFTYVSNTGNFIYVGKKLQSDTHEAFVFLREIEEEKPKCDHTVSYVGASVYEGGTMISGVVSRSKFCPECGEAIDE